MFLISCDEIKTRKSWFFLDLLEIKNSILAFKGIQTFNSALCECVFGSSDSLRSSCLLFSSLDWMKASVL